MHRAKRPVQERLPDTAVDADLELIVIVWRGLSVKDEVRGQLTVDDVPTAADHAIDMVVDGFTTDPALLGQHSANCPFSALCVEHADTEADGDSKY